MILKLRQWLTLLYSICTVYKVSFLKEYFIICSLLDKKKKKTTVLINLFLLSLNLNFKLDFKRTQTLNLKPIIKIYSI